MTIKNLSYKQKMQEIRSFVDFDYDLRKPLAPRSKGKIDTYWNELQEAKGQAYRVYRPRNKKYLKAVKEVSGFGKGLNGFKVAVISNPDPDNPFKVKIKNGEVTFKSNHSNRRVYLFNQLNLINDPKAEINRVLSIIPKKHFKTITAGKFEFSFRTVIDKTIHEKVIRLMNEYGNEKKNNYYQNWLFGIIGIEIVNQEKMNIADQKRAIYRTTKNPKKRKQLLNKLATKNGKKKTSAKNRNG